MQLRGCSPSQFGAWGRCEGTPYTLEMLQAFQRGEGGQLLDLAAGRLLK